MVSIGTTVFLLCRPCVNSGVNELVLGMAVPRDISLLDAEAFLGRSGREATLGMALLVKTNRGWIDVRFRIHRLPRSCEVIGSNTHSRSSDLGK
ncbi:hypothetical protein Bca101_043437 [Brassica carinata]